MVMMTMLTRLYGAFPIELDSFFLLRLYYALLPGSTLRMPGIIVRWIRPRVKEADEMEADESRNPDERG